MGARQKNRQINRDSLFWRNKYRLTSAACGGENDANCGLIRHHESCPRPLFRGQMTPPRTIALIGKYKSPSIIESLCLLASNLDERGIEVIVEEATVNLSVASDDF